MVLFLICSSKEDKAWPNSGGNGGRGGDVILECSAAVWDFSSLTHHINAKRGGNGASKNMIGSRGADKVVQVPVGTVVHVIEGEIPPVVGRSSSDEVDPWDLPGELDSSLSASSQQPLCIDSNRMKSKKTSSSKRDTTASAYVEGLASSKLTTYSLSVKSHQFSCSGEKSVNQGVASDGGCVMSEIECNELEDTESIRYNAAELTELGQRIVVARGGEGGLGNVSSAKASRKIQKCTDVSSFDDDDDDDEHELHRAGFLGSEVVLILELKSIADVGLVGMPNAGKSTLLAAISRAQPTVGDYAFTTLYPNLGKLNYDDLSMTVADIPGLIRGAHENRGLGHAFLRHIERTKVLAYVVDLAAAIDGRKGIPPWQQLRDLVLELELYHEGLSNRPSLVVANKIDEDGAEEVLEELKRRVSGVPIFPICAILEEGVAELKDGLRMLVNGRELSRLNLDNIVLD